MGLKSKIITGLAIAGCCAMLGGMTGAITTGVLSTQHQEKAFAMLKTDETYRLTTEFEVEKNEFEVATEKFATGEIGEIEYKISEIKFGDAKKDYEDDLKNLESSSYLQGLIKSVPQSEECAKEYEKAQNLGAAMGGCISAGLAGLVATVPSMVDGTVSHKAYRRGWIER